MARGYGMALLAAISVAYLIHGSSAQTTYTVGDTTGWTVVQNDPAFYSTWAGNKTFKIGDILVFNFDANRHDVAKVTKADYDVCTSSSPISLSSTSPVRITIDASGMHYFFCNIPGHCTSGQKLMINVSDASSSPAPQPSATPAPQASTPTPSSSPSPVSTPPASTPAPATSPPASTPAPATSPPASTPAPATSPPASTPAPATSPPASTPAPATSPPASTPPPTPAPGTSPPPPNSAASLGFAGFTTFLSIFVALCY